LFPIRVPVIGNTSAVEPIASGSATDAPASAGVSAKALQSVCTGCASACVWTLMASKGPRVPKSRGTQCETQWDWKSR